MRKAKAPAVSVYALVRKKGRILLTQDHHKPGWKLPGGGVEKEELIIEALRREVREEVNLEIRIRQLLGIANWLKKGSSQARIRIYFGAEVHGGQLSLGENEVSAARWFSREELRRLKKGDFLLPQHYYQAVKYYLEGRGTPLKSGGRLDPRRHDLIPGK